MFWKEHFLRWRVIHIVKCHAIYVQSGLSEINLFSVWIKQQTKYQTNYIDFLRVLWHLQAFFSGWAKENILFDQKVTKNSLKSVRTFCAIVPPPMDAYIFVEIRIFNSCSEERGRGYIINKPNWLCQITIRIFLIFIILIMGFQSGLSHLELFGPIG